MFLGSGLVLPLVNIPASKNVGFVLMAAILGAVMMITALITVGIVREPMTERPAPTAGFFRTYLHVFTNGPYVLILLAWTFHTMAITVVSGILVYYFKYIHLAEEKTTLALLIFLGVAVAVIPLSVLLSRRIGKKAVYIIGMLTLSLVVMTVFLLAHDRPVGFTFAMMVGAGIGMGLIYPMPFSIVPDAIEYDYLKTGRRNEGAFYGIWTFLTKVGQALAIGVMGWTLSLSGFIANQTQAESAILSIRILVGPVTTLFFLFGVLVLAFYPITEKRYAEILSAIDRMESEQTK
jgi:GPH family glycoside/pentoside/hexuronide:cation symporter